MSFYYHTELPLPSDFKETYPLSEKMKEAKCRRDREISDIFTGKSHRFLVSSVPALRTEKTLSASMSVAWLKSVRKLKTAC